jgi:hypothetical protein
VGSLANTVCVRHIRLFEFTDQPWYPRTFRRIQTDYLQFAATMGAGHEALVPLLARAMAHAGATTIVDLCSGGTGPWARLKGQLAAAGLDVRVTLTDKYPTPEAARTWAASPDQGITYLEEPVDALAVPAHLTGMRTLFEGFHHFAPDEAHAILRDAAESRAAIGVFEASLKPPLGPLVLLLSPLMTLLGYVFATPFIKPPTVSRFFWTYLLPLVPLASCWDGVVSLLSVYSPKDLAELTGPLRREDYVWEIGQASTGTPLFVFTTLVGYPIGKDEGWGTSDLSGGGDERWGVHG